MESSRAGQSRNDQPPVNIAAQADRQSQPTPRYSALTHQAGPGAEGRPTLTVTVDEAATLLGISRTLAYELVTRGELPHLRLGRRILMSRRALEAMVDGPDRTA